VNLSVDFSDKLAEGREADRNREVDLEFVVETLPVPILPVTVFLRAGDGDIERHKEGAGGFRVVLGTVVGAEDRGTAVRKERIAESGSRKNSSICRRSA
jgi:hypothetical protein